HDEHDGGDGDQEEEWLPNGLVLFLKEAPRTALVLREHEREKALDDVDPLVRIVGVLEVLLRPALRPEIEREAHDRDHEEENDRRARRRSRGRVRRPRWSYGRGFWARLDGFWARRDRRIGRLPCRFRSFRGLGRLTGAVGFGRSRLGCGRRGVRL